MNAILAIPVTVRLALLLVCGAFTGSLINLACYRLAWNQRAISPWSAAPKKARERTWRDRVPIVGWLRMGREAKWHGPNFWVRPALVELLSAAGFAAFYWWTCVERGLLILLPGAPPAGAMVANNIDLALHLSYLAEIVLISFMAVATLIDIDEQTIPDTVTVPGTLLGLVFADSLSLVASAGCSLACRAASDVDRFSAYHFARRMARSFPELARLAARLHVLVGLVPGDDVAAVVRTSRLAARTGNRRDTRPASSLYLGRQRRDHW